MHKIDIHNERYSRQVRLPELGTAGQEKLAHARVLVIGAGGLGCPVLQYLAAAGVGYIGVADGDIVQASNLHRQILFGPEDIGILKVKAAAAAIRRVNPDVTIKQYPFFLYNVLAMEVLPKYDIIVDCTDNFATRYMLNDACAILKKPLVLAALSQWEGQVTVLHVAANDEKRGINYRDIFPDPPGANEVPNCVEAGVLGVLPGVIGTMQAAEVIKWITGIGQLLQNSMLTYNMKTAESWILQVEPSKSIAGPSDKEAFLKINYEWLCGARDVTEISGKDLQDKIRSGAVFIDVRELNEKPELPVPHQRMPLSQLRNQKVQVEGDQVVVVCHLGIRSIEAVRLLSQFAPAGQKLYSLKGGIMALAAAVTTESL